MKFFLTSLSTGAACALMFCASGAAHAADAGAFEPPVHMADNWSQLADQVAVGRIRKVDPWKKHERFAPCVADANVCQLLAQHLLVLIVDVAKSPRGDVQWAVSVPDEQQPKVGQYVQFTLPSTAKELAGGAYDRGGKLVVLPCKWGPADGGIKGDEGVVCPKWNYSQLKYLARSAAQPPAPAPTASAASAASAASHP